MIPILETRRLKLRPLRLSDAPQIQKNFPHWEIVQFMNPLIPWPYPADGARHFLEEIALPAMQAGQEYTWAITLKANNDDLHIGSIGLYPHKEENRGFWLAKEFHRQGIMQEAVYAVNEFAFYQLQMPQLHLCNAEPNIASHKIKEISGAKIIEIVPDIDYVGGKFRRIKWLLTCEDWERYKYTKPSADA